MSEMKFKEKMPLMRNLHFSGYSMKKRYLISIVFIVCLIAVLVDVVKYYNHKNFEKSNECTEFFLYDTGRINSYYIAIDKYGIISYSKGKMTQGYEDEFGYDIILYKKVLNESFITYEKESNFVKMNYLDYKAFKFYAKKIKSEYPVTEDIYDLCPINYATDTYKIIVMKSNGLYYDIQQVFFKNNVILDNSFDITPAVKLENIVFKYISIEERERRYYGVKDVFN